MKLFGFYLAVLLVLGGVGIGIIVGLRALGLLKDPGVGAVVGIGLGVVAVLGANLLTGRYGPLD